MKKISFTKEGYEDLLKQKNELESQRVEAVKELSIARDMGDRSENAAYKSARQKLSGIDRRLRSMTIQLRFAEVILPREDGVIGLGSKVTVDDGKTTKEFIIVGGYESDLAIGRLSFYSPLGKSLLGKKSGETAYFFAPVGKIEYKITNVT